MQSEKRARTSPSNDTVEAPADADQSKPFFSVEFEQSSAFKQFVDVVGSVLQRCHVIVKSTSVDDEVAVSIDTVDTSHVSIVQARILCSGFVDSGEHVFCVDTGVLSKCLRNMPMHNSVRLSGVRNSANVMLTSFDDASSGLENDDDIEFELPTFDEELESVPIQPLQYAFETELDLPMFKKTIKLGDALGCEKITFSQSVVLRRGVPEARTEIQGHGTAAFRRTFSASRVESDQGLDMERLNCRAEFDINMLSKFVKNMEHQKINIRFGNNPKTKEPLPMTVLYALGIPDSYVRFVLAPKVDEE